MRKGESSRSARLARFSRQRKKEPRKAVRAARKRKDGKGFAKRFLDELAGGTRERNGY